MMATNGIAAKNTMQKRQRAEETLVAPRSIDPHSCGCRTNSVARAITRATKKGRKMAFQLASSSKPGRIDLFSKGAPAQTTLMAKSSFIANHSRCGVD